MAIPDSFIQELLSRVDVVEVVGRYVQLKKSGANFMGLCPFHGEKSPSFSVSPTKQFYHCFGCGKNGSAIRFLMDHANLSFVEAVSELAQSQGMVIPQDEASPEDRAREKAQRLKQHTLTEVLEKAAQAYRVRLKASPRAIEYFKQRGLSGSIAKQFGLGYAPAGWHNLASVFPHYDDPMLVDAGLVIAPEAEGNEPAKRYDRFRDRVMFPIRNIKGECIGFGGRVLDGGTPKYLNSPETEVFSKGRELYGLFEARNALREHGYALVTEGYMDVVALAQWGFPNAVATLGTACTDDHIKKLFRFTDAVVFSFDGDAAGRRAAHKALLASLPYANDARSIKFLFLPTEHDPDSYVRTYGKEVFARCISEATPLSKFLIDSSREGCDLQTAEGRAKLCSNAKPLCLPLPEGALKLQLVAEIAELALLSHRELLELWNPQAPAATPTRPRFGKPGATRALPPQASRPPARGARRSAPRSQLASRIDHAARLLLTHSHLWLQLSPEDHAMLCGLPTPHGNLFVWLEGQLLDQGALHWNALLAGLHAEPERSLALQIMADPLLNEDSGTESQVELRELLNRMLIERIKQQETQALEQCTHDPTALARYRELVERRKGLENSLNST
jgi:DNA primase